MLSVSVHHGNYFDHLLDWEKEIETHPDIPIFISQFEDMKRVRCLGITVHTCLTD